MRLSLALFLSCAFALSIPDPINEQERNDEIAQSQVRARYLACLLVYRNLKKELKDFEEIMAATKFDKDLTRKKIFGDLLYKCDSTMTYKLAEELLTADRMDLKKDELKEIVEINTQQFLDGKDIKLTEQQEEVIKKITDEANRNDDGFDQEPPILSDFDVNSYMHGKELLHPVLHYFGLAGGVSLLLVLASIMIKKIIALSSKDKAKKKTKKTAKKNN